MVIKNRKIYETALLTAREYEENAEDLAGIVMDVNDMQPAPEEILFYHAYRCSRLIGEVAITA